MNPRSPYPDVEVPEISPPRFILDRAGVRGTAVPLMGPADPGTATPLMGPATTGTVTPLMGPAAPATVTPLMGPAAPATVTSLLGPRRSRHDGLAHGSRRPGHGHAADAPKAVMPRSDRRTDVSPGPAAVRPPGLAAPAGNRSRHRVTGADAGAVADRQLRG